MELIARNVTLGISSAGQHGDGFTRAGQILEKFSGVLPLRYDRASHACPGSLSPAKKIKMNSSISLRRRVPLSVREAGEIL